MTSVTIRAFPNVPMLTGSLNLARSTADDKFWLLVRHVFSHVPALNDFGASGVSTIIPQNIGSNEINAVLQISFLFVNNTDDKGIRKALAPLASALSSVSDNTTTSDPLNFTFNITSYPTITDFFAKNLKEADVTGSSGTLGSRLISRHFFNPPDGPAQLTSALSKIKLGPGELISNNFVGGGAVARNAATISSAVHPAWREALAHIIFGRGWSSNATFAEQERIRREVTEVQVPLLKALQPDTGAYLNEADAEEPDFRRAFWGSNYPRLAAVKKRWDPDGLFIVRAGVGSEEWDEEGICRVLY